MNSDNALDPRVHPYRDDIAADFLEGRIEAKAFVAGQEHRVAAASTPVMTKPDGGAPQASELLFGEAFTVYDEKDGWSWGQCGHDGYVGYVPSGDLSHDLAQPTHWVTAVRSLVYPDPKGEYPAALGLGFMAQVAVEEEEGDYAGLATGGWMFKKHLAAIGDTWPDFTATATGLSGVPYLWGGRGGLGIDCSGLIQVPLAAAGISVPRDSDQQADAIGADVPVPDDPADLQSADLQSADLRAGDILFFPGHVGIYLGAGEFLHASSFDMMVVTHRLEDVLKRMEERHGKGITRVRRVEGGKT